MFTHYWKISLRNLLRNKGYSFINMLGLTVGIAASLVIFLVIRFETSFDNFHAKKAGICRIGTEIHNQDGISYSDAVALAAGPALRLDFPQLQGVASVYKQGGQVTVENGNMPGKKLMEDDFYYAEPAFFNMFDFGWLSGNAANSLKDPNSVALTQATAEKLFGNWKAAIGKTIRFQNKTLYTVTGILKNIPANTDFPLSMVASYSALQNTILKNSLGDWVGTFGGACTFVVLPQGLSISAFNKELKTFAEKHKPAAYAKDAPFAQPLAEIHYDDRFGNYRGHTFSHSLINVLFVIGVFLLAIACINFINLATARAVNRSKEVGVKKVLGSNRKQLMVQFLCETSMITAIAFIAGVIIARTTLPFFNSLLEVQLSLNFITDPTLLLFVLIAWILTTLLSGIYPAIILSGFDPLVAIKNKMTSGITSGISLKRALVVFQFCIAHILIIGMIVVVSQMDYFRDASLGFDKSAIINVHIPNDSISRTKIGFLKNSLLQEPGIRNISFSFESPAAENTWNSRFRFDHSTSPVNFKANLKWADVDYFNMYNLQFVAGRPYYPGDTVREFVVNETLLSKLGIRDPKEALGKEINFWNGGKVALIVGVIRDFNSNSLREPVAPVVLSTWKDVYQTINIKIRPGAEKTVLPVVEKLCNNAFPAYVYQYSYLDETIGNFYKQEARLSMLYKIFAGIAIFISCLGLYGLVSFMAVKRVKEIGIRKVLGATGSNIIFLLSKEFTVLIIIAFVISAPVAYYFMQRWLENYTYRIRPGLSIFLMAIISSVIIAWVTVAWRAIYAAMANPVTSLRSE